MSNNTAAVAASAVSAYIQCLELPIPPIVFQYNPEPFTEDLRSHWKASPQPGGSPKQQYLGLGASTLSLTMQLDAFAIPPLPPTVTIEQLKLMMGPTIQSSVAHQGRAPMVMFGWGPNIVMEQAIITGISVKHERFLLGVPVRCKVTVTLTNVPFADPLPGTNPTSGGLATRRTRTVVEGDSLASIAFEEYQDPNYWRALAEANGIDDPMRVKTGTLLTVPEKRDAESLLGGSSS